MKQKPKSLRKNPSKKYFTLLVRHKKSDLYEIHFGDYNRSVVMQEDEDTFDDFYCSQIIGTEDDQESIERKVLEVNQVCIVTMKSAGFTIHKLNKLAKPYGLKLYAGKGYYYWNCLRDELHTPDSVYVYRFNQCNEKSWKQELESAIEQSRGDIL